MQVTDFIIDQTLDKAEITSKIRGIIEKMPVDKRKQLITRDPSPIMEQIIINKFVWKQLASKKESKTRQLFEGLKAYCLEVVKRDSTGFIIDQNKLNKLLKRMTMSSGEKNDTMEESLIMSDSIIPGVNMNLLKDAILAYAFENHSIDVSPVDIEIGVKQKVPSNFLFRFFKLDLRDVHLDYKNKLNYGINYHIIDDKLCFYGISQNYFKGKTLIIQIKTIQHRIMKEIWIHGVSKGYQRDDSFVIKDEPEARGQGYEIY